MTIESVIAEFEKEVNARAELEGRFRPREEKEALAEAAKAAVKVFSIGVLLGSLVAVGRD